MKGLFLTRSGLCFIGEYMENTVVIKVGTNTLIERCADGSERLDTASFRRIGRQVLQLREAGSGVVLVSSAAITAGMVHTGLATRPDKTTQMPELQRLASIGWRHVLNAWDDSLPGATVGELLLTEHELDMKHEREEAVRVTHALLSHSDVAVANENDAVRHEQISYGDNDTLAATLATRLGRSTLFGTVRLVVLSDVHGVYRDRHDPSTVISEIDDIAAYSHLAAGTSQPHATGGMTTKFEAARIATKSGVDMYIAHGRTENAIQRVLNGEIGTRFPAKPDA